MHRTPDDIQALLTAELERIRDPDRQSRAAAILTRPTLQSIGWDYGVPGDRLDCWLVGRSGDGGMDIVYCDGGFGPEQPWGFVFPRDDSVGMGRQWHVSLEETLAAAGLLGDESPAAP